MGERYEIRRKIGAGGAGAVYEAEDMLLGRSVAIKRLLPADESESAELSEGSLQKETAALSALQHPNIVTIYDVGEDEDGQYVVMELIDGENIEEVAERETMELDPFLEFAGQTLDGLAAAQSLDLMHRDIKPRNLMIHWLPDGKPLGKILDFGLAKFAPKPALQTMDHNKAVMGTVFYMAPEQFERRPLDRRTDIYSLGSVFYYALAGHDPFDGKSAVEVMNAHLEHRVHNLRHFRPDLPEPLSDWMMWLINREMDDRPESAEEALSVFAEMRTRGFNPVPGTATRKLRLGAPSKKPNLISAATGSVMERYATTGLVPDIGSGQLTRPPTATTGPAPTLKKTTGTSQAVAGTTATTASGTALVRHTTGQTTVGAIAKDTAEEPKNKALIWFGALGTGVALAAVGIVLAASLNKSDDDTPNRIEPSFAIFDEGSSGTVVAAPKGMPEWKGGGGDNLFAEQNWRGGKVPEPGGKARLPSGLKRSIKRVNAPLNLTVLGDLEVETYYDVIGKDGKPGFLCVEAGGRVKVGANGKSKLVVGRMTSGFTEARGKLEVTSDLEIGDTKGTKARLTVDGGEVTAPKLIGGNCQWELAITSGGKLTIKGESLFGNGEGTIKISGGGLFRTGKIGGIPRPEVMVTLESGGKIQVEGNEAENLLRGWIEDGKIQSPSPLEVKKIDANKKSYFQISTK